MKSTFVEQDGQFETWRNDATGDTYGFVTFPVVNGRMATHVTIRDQRERLWRINYPFAEETIAEPEFDPQPEVEDTGVYLDIDLRGMAIYAFAFLMLAMGTLSSLGLLLWWVRVR